MKSSKVSERKGFLEEFLTLKMESLRGRLAKEGWEAIWVKVFVREEGDVSCERSEALATGLDGS